MIIKASTRKGKKFMAVFNNGQTVHFGQKGSKTFIDHGDEVKRKNYLARHATEDYSSPYTPASLSRYLTWGDYTTLEQNHNAYMKKFNINRKIYDKN